MGLLDAESGTNVRFAYGDPVPPEMRDRYHVASMDTPIVPVDVMKTGNPMVITDTLSLTPRYRHIVNETAEMVRACIMGQPLRVVRTDESSARSGDAVADAARIRSR